jgi:tRNA threonylcarbamoyladenosine biosynthesis protein TsaE
MQWTFSIENIHDVAKQFWSRFEKARVFAFHGEMGAGKTTFIHALCDIKNVEDVVGSPTFSIINEYMFHDKDGTGKIFHIDLYRMKDEEEAIRAGVEDCLCSDDICMVEWPDKALALFPPGTIHVSIKALTDNTRQVQIGNN